MPKDFRDHSVAATKRELGITSPQAAIASGRSACIELPPALRVDLSGTGRLMTLLLIFSAVFLLVAIVSAIMIWAGALRPAGPRWVMPLASAAIALVAFVLTMTREKRCFSRIAPLTFPGAEFLHREPVGIEPAETYNKFKIIADDLGLLYHDIADSRLLIMSAGHCYCICAADVLSLQRGEGGVGSGVQVDVRIGSSVLRIVISAREGLHDKEDLAAPFDAKGYFLRRLNQTLGCGVEAEQLEM